MDLNRRPNETPFEHHKRIVYGKLEDKTLSDYDYAELSDYMFGKHYAPDETRKRAYGSFYTLKLQEAEQKGKCKDKRLLSEIDEKLIELRKEKQKFFDQRNAFNKVVRERARQEELNEILTEAIQNGELVDLEYTPTYIGTSDSDLIVTMNDIHYGANVDNAWCTYNTDVCKVMMNNYLGKIIRIAETHGSENCIIAMAGDAINGQIHYSVAMENKENIIQQVKGVSELLAQFISALSPHFKSVRFVSVAGNHSRITQNKNDALKDERLDDLIEWYLEARLSDFDNVVIDRDAKIDTTMALFDVRGKTYSLTHGDYEVNQSKIQSLQTMARKPLYAAITGHLHHNATDEVQGIKTLMGGSFMGINDYCVTKRIYGHPAQLVCVVDDEGVRCSYDVDLSIDNT